MNQQEVAQTVRDFTVASFLFGEADERFTDDASFLETGILELVAFIQNRFGFQIQNGQMMPENLDSVSNVARYVMRKTAPVRESSCPTENSFWRSRVFILSR